MVRDDDIADFDSNFVVLFPSTLCLTHVDRERIDDDDDRMYHRRLNRTLSLCVRGFMSSFVRSGDQGDVSLVFTPSSSSS